MVTMLAGMKVMRSRVVAPGSFAVMPEGGSIVLHPADYAWLAGRQDAAGALAIVAEHHVDEVDRRLRAAGMYPLTPEQCSHPSGLPRDTLRMLYRCDRCGFGITTSR